MGEKKKRAAKIDHEFTVTEGGDRYMGFILLFHRCGCVHISTETQKLGMNFKKWKVLH